MPTPFSRYAPYAHRSFALRAFNGHETEINQHYWSFKVVSEFSGRLARQQKLSNPNEPTASLFHASGPNALRIPATVSDWLEAREKLENWLRLSAIVSASSYLETYLRQVIRSALMSDPLCRFGNGHVLDGTILLKSGKELPFSDEIESITKRDWPSRNHAFKTIFGSSLPILTANLARLERIRKIRNDFAHGFGRSLDVPVPSNVSPGSPTGISIDALVKDFSAISKVAAGIDKFLLQNFIGNFEFIHFYHEWKNQPRIAGEKSYTAQRALQRAFARAKINVSASFCSDLIKYYDSI
jgi:hypothetical protein